MADPDDTDVFRKEALDRLARRDRAEVSLAVGSARPWLALAAAVLLAAAAALCLALFTG